VGQAIVLCRLPTLPEGGRPQSALVCPTKVNSIDGVMTDLNTLVPADSPCVCCGRRVSIPDVHAFLATPGNGGYDDSSSPAGTLTQTA
jgi:hypothetical protein